MDTELPIRIAVLHVPPGVTFAIQRGKHELLPPSRSKVGSLIFDLSVRVSERKGGGSPNVLGAYAQGKPGDRFIYLNSGTMAAQPKSRFTRRAKIKTGGITWKLVEQALADGGVVETWIVPAKDTFMRREAACNCKCRGSDAITGAISMSSITSTRRSLASIRPRECRWHCMAKSAVCSAVSMGGD